MKASSKRKLYLRVILIGMLLTLPIFAFTPHPKNNPLAAATQMLTVAAAKPQPHASANPDSSPPVKLIAASAKPAQAAAKSAAQPAVQSAVRPQKTVYLTFDDGPSIVTRKVLQILQNYGVKGTFFVLGNQAQTRPELITAIAEQGNVIGNHTYNHNYSELYSSFTVFWKQIKQTEEIVREITGVRPQLVRAPGGTYGHFDSTYFKLLKQAGYNVMDWTVDSGDSRRKGVPAAEILQEATADLKSREVVLLLHDGAGHEASAQALPHIIERFKAAGYAFDVLDPNAAPVQFRVSPKAAAAGRIPPSAAWVASNIAPNAALFAPGKPLVLEVGNMQTELKPGEYSIVSGQYMVPLRAVVERFGGKVYWDAATHRGRVVWGGRVVTADPERQQLVMERLGATAVTRDVRISLIGSSLWVGLRELLETVGYPPKSVSVTADERKVKAG
ncbi:polysaccharide deacetylase [Paenibacillus sp. NFR01]|uniref:polysaccharide deacetylase n=1 Tax=Paenibacillus sp. NFR01 TaxID=1566279 RepID=UPI0008B4817D|nr:polysaccharide deacetylase [Paenibacillus sp. NFR01]SEU28960.1 Peptidoglycan/xylan/chitin deacetylase, PgdA/CDA1 family [Paenibacillus sp. NFR01]